VLIKREQESTASHSSSCIGSLYPGVPAANDNHIKGGIHDF
jgi:hypothetical protein